MRHQLDTGQYCSAIVVSDAEMAAISIQGAAFYGEWNYHQILIAQIERLSRDPYTAVSLHALQNLLRMFAKFLFAFPNFVSRPAISFPPNLPGRLTLLIKIIELLLVFERVHRREEAVIFV